jgi:hypothetical protein
MPKYRILFKYSGDGNILIIYIFFKKKALTVVSLRMDRLALEKLIQCRVVVLSKRSQRESVEMLLVRLTAVSSHVYLNTSFKNCVERRVIQTIIVCDAAIWKSITSR